MPSVALDQFDAIFGTRRGGAKERTLCEHLFGQAKVPTGLTLILGPSGGGKSVLCTLLAAKLAEQGTQVIYLDSDRACDELLQAQDEVTCHSPDLGRGLEDAERISYTLLSDGAAALFLDSLESSLARYQPSDYREALNKLVEIAHRLRCPIIATSKYLGMVESTDVAGKCEAVISVTAKNGDTSSVITCRTKFSDETLAGRGSGLLFDFVSRQSKIL